MKYVILLSLMSFNLFSQEPPTAFINLCKTTFKNNPKSLPLCEKIHQKFFSSNKTADAVPVTPADVGALSSPIDGKIQYFMFNDPNYLSGVAYCYFVFRNWISPSQIDPTNLATNASGFSILNEDIKDYHKWLDASVEGKKCKSRVEKDSRVSVVNLEDSLKGKIAMIGLNPFASIQSTDPTFDGVMKEMILTVNHERILAYQVACPDFEKWSISEWNKLSGAKKGEYEKKYPGYTWSTPKVAGRQYIAFLYEGMPEKITEQVKNCKLK